MRLRKGLLNIIEFTDEETVRKIGVVQETSRPYRLKVEAWALSQARLRRVNTPRVLDYYRDSNGREVLVLERIYGKHLSRRISEENANCMFEVGRQMNLLENISSNYGWIDPNSRSGTTHRWKSFISSYVRAYGDQLVRGKIVEAKYMPKVYDAINDVDLDILKPHLVNRDIKPSNIIKDDNGRIWIVDWENTILGDPLYDLAIFGVKYGHGVLWKNLVIGYGFNTDVSSTKYALYEIIGLIGIIDFYHKNQISYHGKQKQLHKLIQRFNQKIG